MNYKTSMRITNGKYEYEVAKVDEGLVVYGRREARKLDSSFERIPKKDEKSVRAFLRGYGVKADFGSRKGEKINEFSSRIRIRFSNSKLED